MDLRIIVLTVLLSLATEISGTVENHKISDEEHVHKDGTHDSSYDHDAFLGKSHGHDFDGLDPKVAKQRLRNMLKKVKLEIIGSKFVY